MGLIINDDDTCHCGAYFQTAGNGYCANGHPRQEAQDKRRTTQMDINDKINQNLRRYYEKTVTTSAVMKMAEKDLELGHIVVLIKELNELMQE